MAGDESEPLMARPSSSHSHRSSASQCKPGLNSDQNASERTPLLARESQESSPDGDYQTIEPPAEPSSDEPVSRKDIGVSWPIAIALTTLCLLALAILVFGFAAPSAIQEYANQAAVLQPVGISIVAFTPAGIRTRVEASFYLDASRVKKPIVRNIGRFATWLGNEVETGESQVEAYLPEYGDILLGAATIPPIKVNIRNGYKNHVDFFSLVKAGNSDAIRGVADDWLEGRLGQLSIKGEATVPLRSGFIRLGSQDITRTFVFQGHDLPNFPNFNVTKLNVHEFQLPGNREAIAADLSLRIQNPYAVGILVPPLSFEILVPNCAPGDEYILVGNATSDTIKVESKKPVFASVTGFVSEVPDSLTTICPGKTTSPLDLLVQSYVKGLETFVYIRGGELSLPDFPDWLGRLFRTITVPVSIPSKGLSNLIKRFSMSRVHFSLPDPFAEPNTPEAQPKISALVQAVVDLPEQVNLPVNISRVRTLADIYYHHKKLGYIDIQKWQHANVRRIRDGHQNSSALSIEFDIKEAPLEIVDEDVFSEVIQKVILTHEPVTLKVKANVAAELVTGLGKFILRNIPATSNFTVKTPLGDGLRSLYPKVESLRILETTKSSILLRAAINFTNPTNYSAKIPFVDMIMRFNGSSVAHISGRNIDIVPGHNAFISIDGLWNPSDSSGPKGTIAGRQLLSRYISGFNTSVIVAPYRGSIPSLPELGRALSSLQVEIPLPKLQIPNGDDDDNNGGDEDRGQPHFIKDATMHLWTSTADFTLISPLERTTLFITSVDATALYNQTSPIGRILYDSPFPVPPGSSRTPRLPVELDLSGAGYEALRKALGGTLEIDAIAQIGVKLGEYSDKISYWGKGIGAKVQL